MTSIPYFVPSKVFGAILQFPWRWQWQSHLVGTSTANSICLSWNRLNWKSLILSLSHSPLPLLLRRCSPDCLCQVRGECDTVMSDALIVLLLTLTPINYTGAFHNLFNRFLWGWQPGGCILYYVEISIHR